MVTCCMHGCSSRSGRERVHFYQIPKYLQRGCQQTIDNRMKQRATWLARIGRKTVTDKTVTKNTVVCSKHFIHGAPANTMDVSNPDWAPSLNLGHEMCSEPQENRYRRRIARANTNRRPLGALENKINDKNNGGGKDINANIAGDIIINENVGDDIVTNENVAGDIVMNENVGDDLVINENVARDNIVENENVAGDIVMNENVGDNIVINENVAGDIVINGNIVDNIVINENVADDIDLNGNTVWFNANENLKVSAVAECQTDIDSFGMNTLMSKARPKFSEEHLASDSKCRFYTGVPSFEVLKLLFNLVAPHIKKNYKKTELTKFQEFASVLVRCRLGLLEEDLADRLNVTQGCVSRFLDLWIPVMAQCLKHLIVWPDRETLQKTMPECFLKSFGRSVAVVIDCFEVTAPSPSGLLAKAQTFSHYKKNPTAKFLIGITPQGTVSYISEAWGGRTSDKFITEHSKAFLDKLLPGDVILADRGFDIGTVTGEVMARVITPSFMHGRLQLSADDVEYSRRIANVRIHVERLIGLVRRKFLILEHRLNYSLLQHAQGHEEARIDDIVLICCAVSNLCNAIVPMSEVVEE